MAITCWWRPAVTGGEQLARMLRRGPADSNTAADHLPLPDAAITVLPPVAGIG